MEQGKSVGSQAEGLGPEDPKTLLILGGEQLGLTLTAQQIDQMLCYLGELLRWNQKINLTAIRQEREIVIKHFLDSLSPLCVLRPQKDDHWIDVGSGGGFPALVLKIAEPLLKITLVEPVEKKAAFLHHLIGCLGMRYVSLINGRLEQLARAARPEGYDLMLTRALSPDLVLGKGRALLRKGGRMLYFQGQWDPNVWAVRLKDYPTLELESHTPVRLPFSRAARTLVVLRGK